jgi:hypothetical protein
MIFFDEGMLRNAIREYLVHYHAERNHQGIGSISFFRACGGLATRTCSPHSGQNCKTPMAAFSTQHR